MTVCADNVSFGPQTVPAGPGTVRRATCSVLARPVGSTPIVQAADIADLSCMRAMRLRVFTVPIGIPVAAAIWTWV